MDGTLLNTLEDLTDSVNYALGLYGYQKRSIEEVRRFLGNGVGKLMEIVVPDGLNNPYTRNVLKVLRIIILTIYEIKQCHIKVLWNLYNSLRRKTIR